MGTRSSNFVSRMLCIGLHVPLFLSQFILGAVDRAMASGVGSAQLQNIMQNTHGDKAYGYPTDFTRGIMPLPLHSHNDYWRAVPFYNALLRGCASIEADVWLINGTLYVGHELSSLSPSRTLSSLYIQPIVDTLTRQNPNTLFAHNTRNGVFDTVASQTLYLWIDIKTEGESGWEAAVQELAPLRERGWLTTYNGSRVVTGPVTVIGTGNAPFDTIASTSPRDYFVDFPLANFSTAFLSGPEPTVSSVLDGLSSYTHISPFATTNFMKLFGWIRSELNTTQLAELKAQISRAKAKGVMVRYWNTPWWPKSTRNNVWVQLWDNGVGLLNADEIDEAAEVVWG